VNTILKRGFTREKTPQLLTTARRIVAALTGNADFPTPDPPLSQIEADVAALAEAQSLYKGPARDAAIRAARATLETDLALLAGNLERTASRDMAKLSTTGFPLRKETSQTSEAPEAPTNLRLQITGITCEVRVLFKASKRAKGYQVQSSLDPNFGVVTDYDPFSGSRNVILRGLPRAKDIWIRVRAIGPHHTKSAWSDPATILVN